MLQTNLQELAALLDPFSLRGYEASISFCKRASRCQGVALTYGEIDLLSFAKLLHDIKMNERSSFLDLGAGIGRALICVGELYPHAKVTGIEIMEPLVQIGRQARRAVKKWHWQNRRKRSGSMALIAGDFLDDRFAPMIGSHEVIWLSATCFSSELLQKVTNQISRHCKKGTLLMILSAPLPEKVSIFTDGRAEVTASLRLWKLAGRKNYSMSWAADHGGVTVHIYEKIDP